MAEVRLYEAIVVNGTPDPALPGFIQVQIPALFGDKTVPSLIPPLYPGASFGGWQSVPQATNPLNDEPVRVIVAHMGRTSFRWLGTSQPFSAITADPANRVGARSKDGRHAIFMDSIEGIFLATASDAEGVTESNFIQITPADDSITIQTAKGDMISIKPEQLAILISDGVDSHALQMDITNGIVMMHKAGISYLSLEDGDITRLNGFDIQISGASIAMGGGVISPIHSYILSATFFADLSLACSDIVATGAAIPAGLPYVAVNATSMIGKIATSLGAGLPYLSSRISGD